MSRRKPFTAPIWLLVLIIATQVLLLYYMIYVQIGWNELAKSRPPVTDGGFPMPTIPSFMPRIIETAILTLLIIAEAFMLWRIRKKHYWKGWAWLHAIFLLLVLTVLPFLILSEGQYRYLIEPHIPLYWILMGLSCICLLLLLWQVRFRQPVFVPDDEANILEEYEN